MNSLSAFHSRFLRCAQFLFRDWQLLNLSSRKRGEEGGGGGKGEGNVPWSEIQVYLLHESVERRFCRLLPVLLTRVVILYAVLVRLHGIMPRWNGRWSCCGSRERCCYTPPTIAAAATAKPRAGTGATGSFGVLRGDQLQS